MHELASSAVGCLLFRCGGWRCLATANGGDPLGSSFEPPSSDTVLREHYWFYQARLVLLVGIVYADDTVYADGMLIVVMYVDGIVYADHCAWLSVKGNVRMF